MRYAKDMNNSVENFTPEFKDGESPSSFFIQELNDRIEQLDSESTTSFEIQDQKNKLALAEHLESNESFDVSLAVQVARDNLAQDEVKFEMRRNGERIPKEFFMDFTERQHLLTQLLTQRSEQEVSTFWRQLREEVRGSESEYQKKMINQLQRGVVSEVAAFKVLQELDQNPKLSLPSEDMYDKIDLWSHGEEGGDTAIQIKSTTEEEASLIRTEHVTPPGVETESDNVLKVYSGQHKKAFIDFQIKVKEYAQKRGMTVESYMLVMPQNQFDRNTGKPAPELVEFFRSEIAK